MRQAALQGWIIFESLFLSYFHLDSGAIGQRLFCFYGISWLSLGLHVAWTSMRLDIGYRRDLDMTTQHCEHILEFLTPSYFSLSR